MKKIILLFLTMFSLTFFSCQEEEQTITQNPENSFVKTSPIASLIARVTQNETSEDNVLDDNSCFSIKLPVTVYINNQSVTVSNEDDYDEVQDIKDEYSNDNDIVYFNFPITIIYANFQQVFVSSQSQLNTIIAQCGDDSDFHEIECIDFNYPITINNYDTNNQIGSTVSVNNDTQLYNFVQSLSSSAVVGIVYPISLTNSNNQVIPINNNTELEETIDNVVDDCENNTIQTELADVLTNGSWYVSYCYYDNDNTNYYTGYTFTFNNDGYVIAQKNATIIEGDWDLHDENTYQRLDLHFDDDVLDDLETDWKVIEFNDSNVRLKKQTSDDTYYLNFKKN